MPEQRVASGTNSDTAVTTRLQPPSQALFARRFPPPPLFPPDTEFSTPFSRRLATSFIFTPSSPPLLSLSHKIETEHMFTC